jgi:two-component system, NtrC family, sensor kinase
MHRKLVRSAPGAGGGPGSHIRRFRQALAGRSLAWRLGLTLTGCLGILLGVGGWYGLEMHRRQLYGLLEQSALDTGETILSSTYSSMLENDQRHIARIIGDVGRRSNVLALRLVDARGEVRYSKRIAEVGQVQDVDSPVCRGCHVGGQVKSPLDLRDGLAAYSLPTGEGVLGLAIPIANLSECSSAACHVHPAGQRVLGVLDLELSAANLERDVQKARQQMAIFSTLAILGISGTVSLLTWRVALRPLRGLLGGIRKLGQDGMWQRLSTEHPAEIGELAISFNQMSGRLEKAQRELETWNETLEQRIREKTAELERARDQMVFTEKMASLGKLSAIMAHEINNPLAGILVYSKLLRRRLATMPPGDNRAEAVDRIREMDEKLALIETETARCGEIVRNLLLFSRRRETARESADLGSIIDRAVRLVSHPADLAQVNVNVALDPRIPVISCDPAEIEQAILALLINAIEAMPDGGRLDIEALLSEPGTEVEIRITDTGPGIPEDVKSRIFEPFFSTKHAGSGTGLGLAVVYGIAERHGGRVTVESPPGRGASFRLCLPLSAPAPTAGKESVDSILHLAGAEAALAHEDSLP